VMPGILVGRLSEERAGVLAMTNDDERAGEDVPRRWPAVVRAGCAGSALSSRAASSYSEHDSVRRVGCRG
jgi:hypothetical protein